MHKYMGTVGSVSRFNQIQQVEVNRFLLRVLNKPGGSHPAHPHYTYRKSGAIILKIAYGYNIEPHKSDPLVSLADVALEQFSVATTPGIWQVDAFPVSPGMGFKKTARFFSDTVHSLTDRPYKFVEKQVSQKIFTPSYLSETLQKGLRVPGSEEEYVVKWAGQSFYAGGADTTVSGLSTFFLAISLYPEVQDKAYKEITDVIGFDRLPELEDRDKLPYIDAIVSETLRWHPVGPMGIPHMSTADDTFQGYHIPKGSVILYNVWGFMRDPDVYHDPMQFKPERFLAVDDYTPEPDPHRFVFGFGRRLCSGRLLADNNMFLTIAQTLAVVKIGNPVQNGKPLVGQPVYQPGVISHPEPFTVSIVPRSEKAEGLVRSVEVKHPWQESDAAALEETLRSG